MKTTSTRFLLLLALTLFSLSLMSGVSAQSQPTPTPRQTATPTPEPEATPIVVPEGWALVWHDEFDDEAIDEANWTYDLGGWGWGNGEAQYYTDRLENARLEEGMLVIEARQERYEESYYTSARLKSQGLQEFQYGRIEARLKVPAGRGLWPAFWMLGSNFEEVGWPDCGEIDIMEYVGREPDLILGTIHGPGYSGALGLTRWNRQDYDIADDFHTYAIEWDENQITWFYDDVAYSTYTREDIGEREWVFDQPFFMILNLAVGGQLAGPIGLDTVFPAQYLVDYVRVFQQEQ
ncbi:MAG: glycoside hydrolase family 16 protein [Chloroflexi bacterium]|nr:glycoside hydrolase family 16 protein [Chloroflexota bacterium]